MTWYGLVYESRIDDEPIQEVFGWSNSKPNVANQKELQGYRLVGLVKAKLKCEDS